MAILDRETYLNLDLTVKEFIDTVIVEELNLPPRVALAFYVAVHLSGGDIDRRYSAADLDAATYLLRDRAAGKVNARANETGH